MERRINAGAVLFVLLASSWTLAGTVRTVQAGKDVPPPRLLKGVEPRLPADRKGHPLPWLILELTIDESGRVAEIQVLKSNDTPLNKTALEAIRQWRYAPTTVKGEKVRVILNITFWYHYL